MKSMKQYENEDNLRTLTQAEEIKGNPKKMKGVMAEVKRQQNYLEKVTGPFGGKPKDKNKSSAYGH